MSFLTNSPPDGPLSALRVGQFPMVLREPVLREAARACAKYVEGGGRLSDIQESASRFQGGHLSLMPLPKDPKPLPRRAELEQDLLLLRSSWDCLIPTSRDATLFWIRFFRELGRRNPVFRAYARLRLKDMARRSREDIAEAYQSFLQQTPQPADLTEGIVGTWRGPGSLSASELHSRIQAEIERQGHSLSQAPRATVHQISLFGETLVVKCFEPNPRNWRKKFGPSRARRAWAGSLLLESCGIRCPPPRGFLEVVKDGSVETSYVIHQWIPDTETFLKWLKGRQRVLTAPERTRLRIFLRNEILALYRRGIYHLDCKLVNMMVRARPGGGLDLFWIDLEDIRVSRRISIRSYVRNLYQINGSLPRRWPEAERLAFLRGFRPYFSYADHPWIVSWVRRKTRKRLSREKQRA